MNDCIKCGEELCKYGQCHECGTCDNHAEAAFERWLENYYGGDTPQTERERQIAAYNEFKAQ